ncbi:GFA family protein [Denitrobaculum tricleocarpae]|uniref:GFA family protein n=1 Tax=Denitrobaculum tricleocarpae TaxID=2591009 RepID=A0A545T3X8_9PROT|nr:GFA family protein [Denitrobaculum tricleocarpae]TQV71931.1 GFA family protein [Denitrobaculum tricleocarpae]
MTKDQTLYTGGCLCGAVNYEITGPLRPVVACHCNQCRKTSGHYVAATQGRWDRLHLKREDGLAWFRSSETASRGFCRDCGSSLFWRRHGDELFSIMAGTLDSPTGLSVACHIYADTKGDYYQIADDVPVAGQDDLEALRP